MRVRDYNTSALRTTQYVSNQEQHQTDYKAKITVEDRASKAPNLNVLVPRHLVSRVHVQRTPTLQRFSAPRDSVSIRFHLLQLTMAAMTAPPPPRG